MTKMKYHVCRVPLDLLLEGLLQPIAARGSLEIK